MQTNPLVSVIIPAYNHEDYVQDTIQSIIDQSYQNIELIIIDDGSKDSTWQRILEMKERAEARFVRVVFETKENSGTCETLNLLLSKIEGKYVYLTASDDLTKKYTIEKEVEFLELNSEYVLAVGDNELIDSDNTRIYWDKNRKTVYNASEAKYLTFTSYLQEFTKDIDYNKNFGEYRSLLKGNYITNGYMLRSNVFDRVDKFTKQAPLEDFWLMLQLSKCGKFKYIDDILFSYRWHDSNSIKNIEKMERYTCQTLMHEYNTFLVQGEKDYLEDILTAIDSRIISKKSKGKKGLFQIIDIERFRSREKIIKFLGLVVYKN